MIQLVDQEIVIRCDCPGCSAEYREPDRNPLGLQAAIRIARQSAEVEAGWFLERIPLKDARDFCPGQHADAYRTALHQLQPERA